MRLAFNLRMQQTQRLVVTPERRQAIAVLQQLIAELSELITSYLLESLPGGGAEGGSRGP